ncbi:39S ribosomal protein L10, mitochondrial [Orchesella cincta]|uniref:Large ribosomal subunit protein uL10m n=1 Tax=Orchesella cincta TaxID=48709 RepID=A0A1D2NIJ7_ORCCI|nr:39S ribosomal protein L10, mitochondrial [Orchesella cincta]
MSALLAKSPASKGLCRVWNLMAQQLRFEGNRPNLKNPKPAHWNRARMLAVCQPVYPPGPRNCEKDALLQKKADNVLEVGIFYRYVWTNFVSRLFLGQGKLRTGTSGDQSRELAFLPHNDHSYSKHDLINIRGSLYDMNFDMRIQKEVNRNMARMSLTGTRWAPLIPLFEGKTSLGFCKEDDISRLMKALKKMPQFLLLAVVAHNRILTKNAIEELEKLRNITNVRTQLCSSLALQSVTLSQNLTANVSALSHSLTTYSQPGEDTSSSSSSDSDSDSDSDSSSSSDSDKEDNNKEK